MKAIKCLKYGGSENLVLVETEKPSPKHNEVLIKIHATSVTASDVLIRRLDEPLVTRLILQLIFGFGKPRNLASHCLLALMLVPYFNLFEL